MALDDLPGELITLTREETVARYKRDYLLRNPDADVAPGTQPDLDARTIADALAPLYSNARLIADGINEDDATGDRLDRVGERYGVKRGAATGAIGYVAVAAASGGGLIKLGQRLTNKATNLKYEAAETKHRNDGEHILIRGVDKGPRSNVDAGVVLQWDSPPPGIGANATVVAQSDGSGLTGGADKQSDASYLESIRSRRRNPPASGNDAHIIEVLLKTPDVPIEQVFTFPTIFGPGSHGFTFTVLASEVGATRIPTAAQLTAAYAHFIGNFPGDDGYYPIAIVAEESALILRVTWADEATGWQDAVPWPAYHATNYVIVDTVTSATAFVLKTADNAYGSVTQPVVGQALGIWDATASGRKFQKKTIKTIVGTGPWTCTFETANGASDTTYTPVVGQRVVPWSDSLVALSASIIAQYTKLGPGEMFASFMGDGRKQRRYPKPPKLWPQSINSDFVVPFSALEEVAGVTFVSATASSPSVGVPGISVRMLTGGNHAVYPT